MSDVTTAAPRPELPARFWLLTAARTVSVGGNGFGRIALAFGVLSLPHSSPALLSLVLAFQAVPQLVFVLLGGVVADRVSRATLLVVAEAVSALSWTGLTVLILEGTPPVWLLCGFAAAAGTASALFAPAMSGLLPQLVTEENLQRANAITRLAQNSALLLGLGVAGVLVAAAGAPWALAADAVSFVASGLLLAAVRVPPASRAASSFLADLREGGREFFSRQWLWVVVAQYAFVVAAVNAFVGVLGPLALHDQPGGAASWGLIVAAQSIGTIGGAALALRVRAARPIRAGVLVTFAFAGPMVLLALRAPVWACAAAMLVSGVANDVFGVLWQSTLQVRVPHEVLSRVSSYDTFGSIAFAPLGLLLAGPAASWIGDEAALLVCAVVVVVATALALAAPQVRSLTGPSEQTA